ncbi:hypothetical protein [Novosphingobium sp. P6W]|uniref:hypothetical protein n=1 Tax=Novosphingobium sp. P6W TaxID=1609758 RepID=UPI000B055BBE|nr:hypothetical protein [Novosphingobium sp. P6W]
MLKRMYANSAYRARIFNITMLICGYGFGQGSIFLAQTWLMTHDSLHLLSLFGTHFSFAMFGIILVEAGSLVTLARHSASVFGQNKSNELCRQGLWQKFWEVTAFRFALSIMVIISIIFYALIYSMDEFSRNYAIFAAPAFVVWSFNGAGLLDGLKLSGISGISGSIAYIASASALLLTQHVSLPMAGAVLGAAFSAGYILTVCVQVVALHASGWTVQFRRPTRVGISVAAHDGFALLGSTLPGQFYFRGQLLLCSAWLGPVPTAILVYVKQIIAAATQLIGFIRRVEFPALVARLSSDSNNPIATIMNAQRLGTWLSGIVAGIVFSGGLVLSQVHNTLPAGLPFYSAAFSITIVSSSIVLALQQGVSALGLYRSLFFRSVVSTAAGLFVSYILIKPFNLIGVLVADLVSAAIGVIIFTLYFRNKSQ